MVRVGLSPNLNPGLGLPSINTGRDEAVMQRVMQRTLSQPNPNPHHGFNHGDSQSWSELDYNAKITLQPPMKRSSWISQ